MASTWPELHAGTNFNYIWDVGTLAWLKETQPSGGTGGGGAVTVADGADVALGTTTDAKIITDTSGTVVGFLRGIASILGDAWSGGTGSGVVRVGVQGTINVKLPNTASATGTISGLGESSAIDLTTGGNYGCASVYLDNTGSFLGTIKFVGVVTGTLQTIEGICLTDGSGPTDSPAFNKIYLIPVGGLSSFAIDCTAYTSGSCSYEIAAGVGTINIPFGTQTVSTIASATGTTSAVADSSSSVTLLSSNTARLGASIANDSTATLYVKLGATASLTSYAAKILPGGYYEVPFHYTGKIDGIWDSHPATGSARIVEMT